MIEYYFIFIYFCLIVSIQSSVGVGILVLGTPFMLIFDYNIIDIFFILLPLSIITSLINLIIMSFLKKKIKKSSLRELKKFLKICMPSILIGLVLLKFFEEYINFKLLVSLIIITSITLISMKEKINFKINFFRISILSVIGIIHGLTNSGGTLMSLALSINNQKNNARYNITLFYFILALSQYFITLILFFKKIIFPEIQLIWAIVFGVIIGNILNNYISEKNYKIIISFLAIISSILLIIN